jgi:cytochrome c peroxidase
MARAYEWRLPPGFPYPVVPEDNPMSVEKVELGRFLFYDTRLSGNQTQACASCHQQARAFSDGLPTARGSTGEIHPRHSMSLTNVAYAPTFAWANPLLLQLEQQAMVPMFGERPIELGLSGREEELLARLAADARYQRLFAEAFPDAAEAIAIDTIVKAIASFVRTLISGRSPFDRYVFDGDDSGMSDSALRGFEMFFLENVECHHCHNAFNFTTSLRFAGQAFDQIDFQNTGLYNIDGKGGYPPPNTGVHEISLDPADMGKFKPPTLRNLAYTAPYMHDGSIASLEEVIDHYAAGGRTIHEGPNAGVGSANPYKSIFVRGFTLSARERTDLLNFLDSLNDDAFVTDRRFSDPFAPACPADCDYTDAVTVSELVGAVGIALGSASLATCLAADSNGDGAVTVNELIAAVNAALQRCP